MQINSRENDLSLSAFFSEEYIILDVGGERFKTKKDTFRLYPGTRLGKLVQYEKVDKILTLCDEFLPGSPPEYFFDYNPESFPGILEMYRTGEFHIPDGGRQCAFVKRRDFHYWWLDELNLEPCCALKYYPGIEVCEAKKLVQTSHANLFYPTPIFVQRALKALNFVGPPSIWSCPPFTFFFVLASIH